MAVLGNIVIVIGGLIFLLAALGLSRFPDAYTRASSVGTAAGLGVTFVVFGAFLVQPGLADGLKVAIIIPLQLATCAVGSMMIARSAYLTGVPMRNPHYDDLGQVASKITD